MSLDQFSDTARRLTIRLLLVFGRGRAPDQREPALVGWLVRPKQSRARHAQATADARAFYDQSASVVANFRRIVVRDEIRR
jgi:hypothetical protein